MIRTLISQMKNSSGNGLAITGVIAVGVVCSWLLLTGKPDPAPKAVVAAPPPPVDVMVVTPKPRSVIVRSQGTVSPRREIDIVAQVSGRIVASGDNFAQGGFVDKDASLVTVEEDDYRFALIKAEARVADALQLLAQEKARARQAQREWRDLGNDEGNQLFLRKPQLASAEAAVASAEADRDQAKINLQRTRIVAPYDGRLRETMVDIGQYVNAGTKIARFYSTDAVEVQLPLTDRQVALLNVPLNYQDDSAKKKLPVTLKAEFGGKVWTWQGFITRTDAEIDIQSRLLNAVVEVSNPFERAADSERPPLAIGQFVEAEIVGREINDVVILPRRAVQPEDKVWVLDNKNQLVTLPVDVLYSDGRQVFVKGDFIENTRVVVAPAAVMIAGRVVVPRDINLQVAGTPKSEAVN
jgi:RND family efflux transporter MFP subunit